MQILTRFNKVIAYSEHGYIPVGNSAVCTATNECYDEALIITVDCVPTDIDNFDYYYVDGRFIKGSAKFRFQFNEPTLNNEYKLADGAGWYYIALRDGIRYYPLGIIYWGGPNSDPYYNDTDSLQCFDYTATYIHEVTIKRCDGTMKVGHFALIDGKWEAADISGTYLIYTSKIHM